MKTKIDFDNVDYGEGVKYIAMNSTEEECRTSDLRRVLPRRRGKTGTRPGVTGEDPLGRERGGQDQWIMPRVKLTDLEKRKIVATVIRIGVVTMFNTHLYTFAGKYFLQKQGGPIGLRSTCAVARITMLDWDNKWQRRIEDNNLEMMNGSRYMDDVRACLHPVKPGWRYKAGELMFCEDWRREESEGGLTGLRKTRLVLEDTMRGVQNYLKMTMETEDDFPDGGLPVPTLDINLWVREDHMIMYTFYEKPMSTNQVLHKDSAMPENTKIASLTQDLVRRMKNTSELVDKVERNKVVDNYAQKLANSEE